MYLIQNQKKKKKKQNLLCLRSNRCSYYTADNWCLSLSILFFFLFWSVVLVCFNAVVWKRWETTNKCDQFEIMTHLTSLFSSVLLLSAYLPSVTRRYLHLIFATFRKFSTIVLYCLDGQSIWLPLQTVYIFDGVVAAFIKRFIERWSEIDTISHIIE